MTKPRLIEHKIITDLQDEVTRLTKQVTRLQTRIRALRQEIARRERDHDSRTGPANPSND